MGIFDKIKKKVTETVDSASKAVSSMADSAGEKFSSMTTQAKQALGLDRLKQGLAKTRESFVNRLSKVLGADRKIDSALLEEVEEILITADIGVKTSSTIIDNVRARVRKEGYQTADKLYVLIKDEILRILGESPSAELDRTFGVKPEQAPYVLMVVGVNGVGKTTSIGKLAFNYREAGKLVLIGAADTFRAAANEQLDVWAQRAEVDIIKQHQGADPAAVAFDTLKAAQSRNADVVIIDTAGRLHNKTGLMSELEKMGRVMKKLKSTAPDEVFLVLDATTGQNAIQQAKEFMKVVPVTGLILTKLDGTAKGGVVIAIANEFKIPVRYIGVGEKIHDLQVFDPVAFVEALFATKVNEEEKLAESETGSTL